MVSTSIISNSDVHKAEHSAWSSDNNELESKNKANKGQVFLSAAKQKPVKLSKMKRKELKRPSKGIIVQD